MRLLTRMIFTVAMLNIAAGAAAEGDKPIDGVRWIEGCQALSQDGWEMHMEFVCVGQAAEYCQLKGKGEPKCIADLTAHFELSAEEAIAALPENAPRGLNRFSARRNVHEREAFANDGYDAACGEGSDLPPDYIPFFCAASHWLQIRSLARMVED